MPNMKKEIKETPDQKHVSDESAASPVITPPAASRFGWMKRPQFIILLVIFLVLYVGLNLWLYRSGTNRPELNFTPVATPTPTSESQSTPTPRYTPIPTPSPTPIRLYPDKGTQGIYNVSQAKNHPGPTITKVIFDPLDVQKGQTLTVFVDMNNPTPIASVSAQLTMDNGTTSFPLSRTSGTDTAGEWKGSVRMTDTVWYKYILTIRATGANGEGQVIVAPRS
ncbi:hypothetical protein A2363_04485 [Candidatus Gottesmanbacteria bacterium RIFOXYB1_FULL_47_11]|uniref:Uncharacterized protein n=1 Tax=Candidatus Gottesmanbacteria bacterium RIFOXYB1_FULL_47_11 TaxID=1798401 RepID=A0A1F6BFL2_9BACT|nr:MAG: hypothetical protein A2363_04485 [Candidatus Gottesmanbacteria bacterium RIFOXYB1_FULL_47_11]